MHSDRWFVVVLVTLCLCVAAAVAASGQPSSADQVGFERLGSQDQELSEERRQAFNKD